nr:sigma-70 family RNA polymerase sigma factor [Propionibacterium sp.]
MVPVTVRRTQDAAATALALAAGAGDRSALAEFIRVTHRDVWRFLAHLTDPDSADDLTQECYLRAMDALPTFRGDAPVRPWLLTIARRCVADAHRRAAVRPRVVVGDLDPDRCPRSLPDASGAVEIRGMLASLDADRREALVLTQLVGFSYAEAARVVGVPVGTIRSRVARARAQLVAEWSDASQETLDVVGVLRAG